jgi:hypothetical protein
MRRMLNHIILPALLPAAFLVTASTPVEVLGCFNRGLIALLISLSSGLTGVWTAFKGARARMRRDPSAQYWVASSLILLIPVILLLIMA